MNLMNTYNNYDFCKLGRVFLQRLKQLGQELPPFLRRQLRKKPAKEDKPAIPKSQENDLFDLSFCLGQVDKMKLPLVHRLYLETMDDFI